MSLKYFLEMWASKKTQSAYERGTLDFDLTEITEDRVQKTIEALTNCKDIDTLEINLDGSSDFQLQCVINALNSNSSIKEFQIKSSNSEVNAITSAQAKMITTGLITNKFIRTVGICSAQTSNSLVAEELFTFLQSNKTILHIELNEILDANIIKALFKSAKQRFCITNILLRDSESINQMVLTSEMIQCLAIENGTNTTLRGLHFDGVKMDNEEVIELTKVLKNYEVLSELSIIFTSFNHESIPALIDLIKANRNLKVLDINSNPIGNEGLRLLSNELKTNTTLRSLNLIATGLLNEEVIENGWKYLFECLKNNTTLTEIIVGGDDEEVESFECYEHIRTILSNNLKRLATNTNPNLFNNKRKLETDSAENNEDTNFNSYTKSSK